MNLDRSVNGSDTYILILDKDHNLLSASNTVSDCDCWNDFLLFKDNRLIGISGVPEHKFQSNVFNGGAGRKTILLKSRKEGDEGGRLLLRITPLHSTSLESLPSNAPSVCLEIQTLDTFFTEAANRVSDKFNLTKAETLVLKYLMMGLSSDDIKAKLMIGTPTLRTHQQRLRQKTGEATSIKTILSALNPESLADDLIEFEDF